MNKLMDAKIFVRRGDDGNATIRQLSVSMRDTEGKPGNSKVYRAEFVQGDAAREFAEKLRDMADDIYGDAVGTQSLDSEHREVCPSCGDPFSEDDINGGRCIACGTMICAIQAGDEDELAESDINEEAAQQDG